MRCERCGFENMPGLKSCVRCSTVLVVERKIEIHPPRAGRWKRLQRFKYWYNRFGGHDASTFVRAHHVKQKIIIFIAILISVIPGLGHLLLRKPRQIVWFWLVWLISLSIGLFLYGMPWSGELLGLAIACHALIIGDMAALHEKFKLWRYRIIGTLILFFILLFGVYGTIRSAVGKHVRGIIAERNMPLDNIQWGDFLVIWKQAYEKEKPQPGDLVLYRLKGGSVAPSVILQGGEVLGNLWGLPGDQVTIREGRVTVTGADHEQINFPAPDYIAGVSVELSIKSGHYFCLFPDFGIRYETASPIPFMVPIPIRALVPFDIEAVIEPFCIVPEGAIQGRAFMVYNPVARRRWIERNLYPLEESDG